MAEKSDRQFANTPLTRISSSQPISRISLVSGSSAVSSFPIGRSFAVITTRVVRKLVSKVINIANTEKFAENVKSPIRVKRVRFALHTSDNVRNNNVRDTKVRNTQSRIRNTRNTHTSRTYEGNAKNN